jgi:hypothetical protein
VYVPGSVSSGIKIDKAANPLSFLGRITSVVLKVISSRNSDSAESLIVSGCVPLLEMCSSKLLKSFYLGESWADSLTRLIS